MKEERTASAAAVTLLVIALLATLHGKSGAAPKQLRPAGCPKAPLESTLEVECTGRGGCTARLIDFGWGDDHDIKYLNDVTAQIVCGYLDVRYSGIDWQLLSAATEFRFTSAVDKRHHRHKLAEVKQVCVAGSYGELANARVVCADVRRAKE